MPPSKEFLNELKEKYELTETLVTERSKHDPPTEPYKSHYEAKDILLQLARTIKDHIKEETADKDQRIQFILARIVVDLGKVHNFVEELTTGEQYLKEALDLVKGYETNPSVICSVLSALNESGILWMNRGETEKAKSYLVDAETFYKTFKESKAEPLSIYDVFDGNSTSEGGKGEKLLEKHNVMTQFYLAQVFGSLGDLEKSAIYCHATLKKQLLLGEYEPIDWALNAATLSQYFCTNDRYSEARHHLAAATQILLEYQKDIIKPGMTDDEKKAAEESFNHRLADVNRCWVKYALNLMSDSRDRLLRDSDSEANVANLKLSGQLKFDSKIEEAYENVITDRYLLDMDDAKPVFLNTLKWIEKAKSYYTPENEATEYSKIIQDQAMAYKHLAFFESDPANQAKMHKRRVDLLEELLDLLNKVFYMNIVRELLYELGMAYTNILDIKLDAFEEGQKMPNCVVNPFALKKINDLITKSRKNFNEFISTYFQAKTQELKPDLSVDELVSIAFSYFQIARISYKFITPDKKLQYENLSICLENYKKFAALCEKHEEVGEKMKAEWGVSKEMISLLPLKLHRLKGDTVA